MRKGVVLYVSINVRNSLAFKRCDDLGINSYDLINYNKGGKNNILNLIHRRPGRNVNTFFSDKDFVHRAISKSIKNLFLTRDLI